MQKAGLKKPAYCRDIESAGELLSRLELADFMGEYRLRSNVIGRRVLVLSGSDSFEALVRDIDDEGRLMVEKGDEVLRLSSGEISIRW